MHINLLGDYFLVDDLESLLNLLEDYTSLTLSEVIDFIRVHLCHDETITLNEDDVKAIKKIELSYLKPEFIYGVNPKYTVIKRKRIEGAGEIEARIEVHNNKIMHINLLGDYFLVGDLESLLNLLEGVSLDARFTSYLNNESTRVRLMADRFVNDKTLKATVKYLELAKEYNVSPVTLAISYSKHFDFVASTIIGARVLSQLDVCMPT